MPIFQDDLVIYDKMEHDRLLAVHRFDVRRLQVACAYAFRALCEDYVTEEERAELVHEFQFAIRSLPTELQSLRDAALLKKPQIE